MNNDETLRKIVIELKADIAKWLKRREPDLDRCRCQKINKDATSEEIKRSIAQNLTENTLGLSRRVIAYFSNPYQKHLAERLTTEIEAAGYPGNFDARIKGVTVYYLPVILHINSTLDDCLLALPETITVRMPKKSGQKIQPQGELELDGEMKALACLTKHPGWSKAKIAREISVNRTTLYEYTLFMQAVELLKETKQDMPRGFKGSESGDIEAWDS